MDIGTVQLDGCNTDPDPTGKKKNICNCGVFYFEKTSADSMKGRRYIMAQLNNRAYVEVVKGSNFVLYRVVVFGLVVFTAIFHAFNMRKTRF